MTRTKLNRLSQLSPPIEGWQRRSSVLARYYKPLLEFLAAEKPGINGREDVGEMTYIANPLVEGELRDFLANTQSEKAFLLGFKGEGKSTTLKQTYGLWTHKETALVQGSTLFSYISFNGYIRPEEGMLVREAIAAALDETLDRLLESQRRSPPTDEYLKLFHAYVRDHTGVINRVRADTRLSHTWETDLQDWKARDRLSYVAARLKFAMDELAVKDFRQLVVVIDDIEPLPPKLRTALSEQMHSIFDCMRNGVKHPVKLIMAMRPQTMKEFRRSETGGARTIRMRVNFGLQELLRAKYEYFVKVDEEGRLIAQRKSAEASFDALQRLFVKFGQHADPILDLTNRCLRDGLSRLTCVLEQVAGKSKAIQREGAFHLADQPSPRSIQTFELIDILGKRGHPTYYSDAREGLANVTKSAEQRESDLLLPVVLQWIHMREQAEGSAHPLVDVEILRESLSVCCGTDHAWLKWFDQIVQWCLEDGLIDSVLDPSNTEKTLYHLMPRGKFLWAILGTSSALAELYVVDTFMSPDELRAFSTDSRGSFFRAIRWAKLLAERELAIQAELVRVDIFWNKVLNQKSVVGHIAMGLEQSFDRWHNERPQADSDLKSLRKTITKLEEKYGRN